VDRVAPSPRRGDIWEADLDPAVGHEAAKRRPVLVVTHDQFNTARNRMCVVVPLTRTDRGLRIQVPIAPPEGGLGQPSVIQCEQPRAISHERLIRYRGRVTPATLDAVATRLRRLLAL
jgi:mRNA interferase MazF